MFLLISIRYWGIIAVRRRVGVSHKRPAHNIPDMNVKTTIIRNYAEVELVHGKEMLAPEMVQTDVCVCLQKVN